MDAIILAAGRGTRMAPICTQRPKPLLPLAGQTVLDALLDGLQAAGVTRVVLVTGYMGDVVEAALGTRDGLDVEAVHQHPIRGTGHAVATAAPRVEGDSLVAVADCTVAPSTFEALAAASGFAMAVAGVERPERFGVVAVDGGRLAGLEEKPDRPGSATVNTGLYRVPAEALRQCGRLEPSPRGEIEFTDVVKQWIPEGVDVVPAEGWHDLGAPWDYLAAHEAVLPARLRPGITGDGDVEQGVVVHGSLHVEADATIRAGTYVDGHVWVGAGADVGPNAYLRGAVAVGPGARVGAASEVKNSILLEGAKAPHHNYVGDSILGCNSNLGSGTKIANLKLTDTTVRVDWQGTLMDTGRRKFGAVIGDDAKTGVNASIMPGAVVDARAVVPAGHVVRGWVAADGAGVTPAVAARY